MWLYFYYKYYIQSMNMSDRNSLALSEKSIRGGEDGTVRHEQLKYIPQNPRSIEPTLSRDVELYDELRDEGNFGGRDFGNFQHCL